MEEALDIFKFVTPFLPWLQADASFDKAHWSLKGQKQVRRRCWVEISIYLRVDLLGDTLVFASLTNTVEWTVKGVVIFLFCAEMDVGSGCLSGSFSSCQSCGETCQPRWCLFHWCVWTLCSFHRSAVKIQLFKLAFMCHFFPLCGKDSKKACISSHLTWLRLEMYLFY